MKKTNKKPHPAIEDLTKKIMHFFYLNCFLQTNFSSFVGYFDFLYIYISFKRGIFYVNLYIESHKCIHVDMKNI